MAAAADVTMRRTRGAHFVVVVVWIDEKFEELSLCPLLLYDHNWPATQITFIHSQSVSNSGFLDGLIVVPAVHHLLQGPIVFRASYRYDVTTIIIY